VVRRYAAIPQPAFTGPTRYRDLDTESGEVNRSRGGASQRATGEHRVEV